MDTLQENIAKSLNDSHPDEAFKMISGVLSVASKEEEILIVELLQSVAHFFVDTESDNLNVMMTGVIADMNMHPQRDEFLESLNNNIDGSVIKNKSGQGALFLPDASEPGRYRYSEFDSSGFFGHRTFDTAQEALFDAWDFGYRYPVSADFLENLAVSEKWSAGMENVHFIAQQNKEQKKVIAP
jgi:hypothetical protein